MHVWIHIRLSKQTLLFSAVSLKSCTLIVSFNVLLLFPFSKFVLYISVKHFELSPCTKGSNQTSLLHKYEMNKLHFIVAFST